MASKPKKNEGTITIEDADIFFLNFAGKATPFNVAGSRNFCVAIPPDIAGQLEADGWNVKMTKPRDEDDQPKPYLQVAVRFDNKPPRITMVTSRARTPVTEDMVAILDFADIEKVDLIINPSLWTVNGKDGIKAYLKTMFVTVAEDELELKYAVNDPGGD